MMMVVGMAVTLIVVPMGMGVMGAVAVKDKVKQRSRHQGLEDAVGEGVLHLVKKQVPGKIREKRDHRDKRQPTHSGSHRESTQRPPYEEALKKPMHKDSVGEGMFVVMKMGLVTGVHKRRTIQRGMERKTQGTENQREPMHPLSQLSEGSLKNTWEEQPNTRQEKGPRPNHPPGVWQSAEKHKRR
jgi:hypothetical protein